MCPELFHIGPFPIRSFGLMAMLGFLIPMFIMRKEFARRSIDPELANNIITGAIIGGFLGARLYFIIEHWNDFLLRPWDYIFSGAGLAWYGGFIGGTLAVFLVIRMSGASAMRVVDVVAPLLILGYAIGRIGCQLAGDGDYGPPSDLPWAMAYPNGVIPTDVRVHPTPIYDTLLSLALFALLWKNRMRYPVPGTMFGLSLVALGIERFITEFFRTLPKIAFGWMTMAQIISIGLILAGIVIIYQVTSRAASRGMQNDAIGTETRIINDVKKKKRK
ncbi:MAG TPA: prolipoprotein diacylglyceryl transferase [Bacteroidetes bacterium]|nr:prolipoprotein diacylglyceryl transferase [Bacteroidota bacterium]